MRQIFFSLLLSLGMIASSVASAEDLENTLYMDLKDGRVVIKLFPDLAPRHVERIKKLAREGFYDGIVFHRVIPGFMAQGGDPTGTGTGDSPYPNLPDEFSSKPHYRGILSMANTGMPNSANSQFFIVTDDSTFLDGKYSVWGEVVEGMQFVDNIKKGSSANNGAIDGEPDRMLKVQVASDAQ